MILVTCGQFHGQFNHFDTTILLRWRYFKLNALWGLKLGQSNQKWDRYAVIMRKNDDSKLEICQIKSKSNQC